MGDLEVETRWGGGDSKSMSRTEGSEVRLQVTSSLTIESTLPSPQFRLAISPAQLSCHSVSSSSSSASCGEDVTSSLELCVAP